MVRFSLINHMHISQQFRLPILSHTWVRYPGFSGHGVKCPILTTVVPRFSSDLIGCTIRSKWGPFGDLYLARKNLLLVWNKLFLGEIKFSQRFAVGAKIPRPSVSGFLPPPWTSWWVNCAIPTAHVVSPYSTPHKICTLFWLCYQIVVNTWDGFIHSFQGCFTGTGSIWLPQCQWNNPEGYG